jgi:hypothetical protein
MTGLIQYLYDAVYLYMKIVDKVVSAGEDYRDGAVILQYSKGVSFFGEIPYAFSNVMKLRNSNVFFLYLVRTCCCS